MTHTAPQNRRNEPDHYDVPAHHGSYPTFALLIEQGVVVPLPRPEDERADPLKGVRSAQTYRLAPGVLPVVTGYRHLTLAGQPIQADLFRLPAHAYSALVTASPTHRAPLCLDVAFTLAREPDVSVRDVRLVLEQSAAHAPRHLDAPHLVPSTLPLQSSWLPEDTLLHMTPGGHWFVTLTFRTTCLTRPLPTERERVALDLGLFPLTTAVHEDGRVQVFHSTPLTLPERGTLTPPAQLLLDQVVYASGRQDAEQVTGYLLRHSSTVVAEQLRVQNLERGFVHRSRDRALLDHHHAALPQALNAARIPLFRLPAGYTSTECPCQTCRHVSPDNRHGALFRCRRCGFTADAHVVAGMNLLRRHERTARRHVRR
ncbi:zinc ribbon domain-containing protein [Deinococcus ficus]|uniref:zinc ribbon domain-containing protein n=1 Tax=Deinococcus ficus TaxID=317577 RepID=UPI0017490645|nr:zinc ribbon domain-containing protein [Deinococcus ficus]GHF78828.1 hypothetical protein GCM10017782_16010 [Deinococcus ficus]